MQQQQLEVEQQQLRPADRKSLESQVVANATFLKYDMFTGFSENTNNLSTYDILLIVSLEKVMQIVEY